MAELSRLQKWSLVRGADIPSSLRLTLYALHCTQGDNSTAWCKRETLADEVGVHVDQLTRKLQALERLKVVTRVWTQRNGRPSREYAIDYVVLSQMQRSTLTNSSECESSTLTNSSESPRRIHQSHLDEFIRHEDPLNIHRTSKGVRARNSRFRKPTADEVRAYATERGVPDFDADHFVDHYEANGWRVGRAAMKDWQATVRKWIRSGGTYRNGNATSGTDAAAAELAWQTLRQTLRSIDRTQPYKVKLRQTLGDRVFNAAETVGWSELFDLNQFTERKLYTLFAAAIGKGA